MGAGLQVTGLCPRRLSNPAGGSTLQVGLASPISQAALTMLQRLFLSASARPSAQRLISNSGSKPWG